MFDWGLYCFIFLLDLLGCTFISFLTLQASSINDKYGLSLTPHLFPFRLLQKSRLKHMNSIVMRDGLRNEVAKQQRIEEEMHAEREQQKMDIAKLNTMINQSEEQMTKLRNRYEKAITHRNER